MYLSHDFSPFWRNRKLSFNPVQWIINNPIVGLLTREKKESFCRIESRPVGFGRDPFWER